MSRVHRVLRVTGGRVAFTNTSRLPDSEIIAEIRALAKVIDMDRVVVHVKQAGKWRASGGRAYSVIPSIANLDGLRRGEWRYLVVVAHFTYSPGWWIRILAHEVKHVEQYRHGKNGSEPPCNAFAAWWVRKRKAA